MQLSKNTSIGRRSKVLNVSIKVAIVSFIIFGVIILLSRIDFPTPNKEIQKTVPNEKLTIVK